MEPWERRRMWRDIGYILLVMVLSVVFVASMTALVAMVGP